MKENSLKKNKLDIFETKSSKNYIKKDETLINELDKLPDGWEWKKIENVFKLKSGDFLPKKEMNNDGSFLVYGGNGVTGKKFNLSGKNIIIGRVGSCGNVRLIEDKIWLTDNAFYISEFFEEVHLNYFEHLLKFINLGKMANQTAQPVISYKSLKDLLIPVPPTPRTKTHCRKTLPFI